MTSKVTPTPSQAYVWTWLPNATQAVVAGLLFQDRDQLLFTYGRSYLERQDAISLYEPELPLQSGTIALKPGLSMPSCIRDASPDAWGRRVLINLKTAKDTGAQPPSDLDELSYLLESGSDRIGALDFQNSPQKYEARLSDQASIEDLFKASEKVEQGQLLSGPLDAALMHGTSLGGARPKVMLNDGDRKWIAKFSSSSDLYSVVKAEFMAMRLAKKLGMNVANVKLSTVLGKDVLLVERFDRAPKDSQWTRRSMVSALTLFGLDEMMAAYASYEKLTDIIRLRFSNPKSTLRELFSRMVFNVLCGNTDDHARNHAAFWDGSQLTLTPAYDICPQSRHGTQASQAMLILGSDRSSTLGACLNAATKFQLGHQEALDLINHQITGVQEAWPSICIEAALSEVDQNHFWKRQFLNPFAFQNAPSGVRLPSA